MFFVEQATDASLEAENWALNIEICDMINESSDSARDAMKAIRKRLTQSAGKNDAVIMLTLTVIETCVKNCGKAFHSLVASKEFIQELVKLIGPKNDPSVAVQERVLSLIQMWADAFRSQPDLNGVVQMYHELKSKGIEFPATDPEATAPIFTPQRVNKTKIMKFISVVTIFIRFLECTGNTTAPASSDSTTTTGTTGWDSSNEQSCGFNSGTNC